MKGLETVWRTLNQEALSEPCVLGSWVMKSSYYSRVTGRDYWAAPEETYLQALVRLGVNLCPQFVMPYDELGNAGAVDGHWANRQRGPRLLIPGLAQAECQSLFIARIGEGVESSGSADVWWAIVVAVR